MNDELKNALSGKKWRIILGILIVILVLLIMSGVGAAKYPQNVFWKTLRPISLGFQHSFGQIPSFFKNIFQIGQIIKQNSSLVTENLELQSELAKLSEVKYENEILKKELQFSQTEEAKTQLIPAAIIGRTSGYLKAMTIDKGEKDGLTKGQAVVSQGFLIGTITEVRPDNSDVTLIADYNSLVPVVLEKSRGTGLLRGGLQGLIIEDIPLNIEIQSGENVVTSGLGGQIPAGIAVGKFLAVISRQGDIFQKVTVASPVDFSRLEVLFVVKK